MTHVMLDIETLGKKPGCVVLAVGAYAFEMAGLYTRNTFYRRIDIFDSLMAGLSIDAGTLTWWRAQSDEAKAALSSGICATLHEAVSDFDAWFMSLGAGPYVWAKSPQFDCEIWQHVIELAGFAVPWDFRAVRDVRTLVDASGIDDKAVPKPDGNIAHHALFDCEWQAEQVRAANAAIVGRR